MTYPLIRILVSEFRSIMPYLDVGVLLDILWTDDPKLEQLQKWESEVKEDPFTWFTKRNPTVPAPISVCPPVHRFPDFVRYVVQRQKINYRVMAYCVFV